MKNKYIPFVLLLLLLVCTSCSSEKKGLAELKRLCEKDAGLTIYKTVEANGFYDASRKDGALRFLIASDYDFIEYCNSAPNIMSFLTEPGCARYTKVAKNSGLCDVRIEKILNKSVVGQNVSFRAKYCIAFEQLDKPEAQYKYNEQLDIWLANNKYSEFIRTEVSIEDRASNEVLGRYISYSYNARPRHTSPKSCRLLDKKFSASIKDELIEKTIVIHKEK